MKQDFKKPNAFELLESRNLKKTPFRLALLDFFIIHDKPLTGLQLYHGLKKNSRTQKLKFDRATVFRNLNTLVSEEILQTTEFGTGSNHFYLKSAHHHHHVFCTKCEVAEPINFCGVAPMIARAKQIGFDVLSHRLDLIGLCPACKP